MALSVQQIDKYECIGNSLSAINSNFVSLSSELANLTTSVADIITTITGVSATDVSRIVAGSNIAISPSSGRGVVTISGTFPGFTGQEILSANTTGTVGASIYKGKNGRSLEFKRIVSGSSNIAIQEEQNAIKIVGLKNDGTLLGEANVLENLGDGIKIAGEKNAIKLPLRTLKQGTGIHLLSGAETITISSTVSGENIGSGVGKLLKKEQHPFQFRSLKAGANVLLTNAENDIIISTTDSLSGVAAKDAGAKIFKNREGNNLVFRTLLPGSNNIQVEEQLNDIRISLTNNISGNNLGTGTPLYVNTDGTTLNFKTLYTGTNISLDPIGTNGVQINATIPSQPGYMAQNLQDNLQVFKRKNGQTLEFRTLSAGKGIDIIQNDTALTISSIQPEIPETTTKVENIGLTGSIGLYAGTSSTNTLQFKSLSSITPVIRLSESGGIVSLSAANVFTNVKYANGSTGEGQIISSTEGNTLTFRKILAGRGITVVNGTTDITISSTSTTDTIIPPGAVVAFATKTAPDGWLICNGDKIPNGTATVQGRLANFSKLYAAIGSSFGSPGQLPDLRGEFVRGWDNGKNIDEERVFGSSQKGTAITFDPTFTNPNVCSVINRGNKIGGNNASNWPDTEKSCKDIGVDHVINPKEYWPDIMNAKQTTTQEPLELATGFFGVGTARPRNIALLYCIKY